LGRAGIIPPHETGNHSHRKPPVSSYRRIGPSYRHTGVVQALMSSYRGIGPRETRMRFVGDFARYPVDTKYQPVSFGIITQVCFCKLDPGLRRDDAWWGLVSPHKHHPQNSTISWGRKGRKHPKHPNFAQKPAEIRHFLRFFRQNRAIFAIFSTFCQFLQFFCNIQYFQPNTRTYCRQQITLTT